jgi:hypothetical protein
MTDVHAYFQLRIRKPTAKQRPKKRMGLLRRLNIV